MLLYSSISFLKASTCMILNIKVLQRSQNDTASKVCKFLLRRSLIRWHEFRIDKQNKNKLRKINEPH